GDDVRSNGRQPLRMPRQVFSCDQRPWPEENPAAYGAIAIRPGDAFDNIAGGCIFSALEDAVDGNLRLVENFPDAAQEFCSADGPVPPPKNCDRARALTHGPDQFPGQLPPNFNGWRSAVSCGLCCCRIAIDGDYRDAVPDKKLNHRSQCL